MSEGQPSEEDKKKFFSIFGDDVSLLKEPGETLMELWARLRAELQPVGTLEDILLERMASCAWKLRHGHGSESELGRGFYRALEELQRRQAIRIQSDSGSK